MVSFLMNSHASSSKNVLNVASFAGAARAWGVKAHALAMQQIEEGREKIRAFCHEHARGEAAESGGEVLSLENWLEEIRTKRPLSRREKLERALREAINSEDYEKAAKVRDELRNLKQI